MPFSVYQFSFDDTQKRATIILMGENNNIINCSFHLEVQEDESIEGIKRKAMAAFSELAATAVKDALSSMPEPPPKP